MPSLNALNLDGTPRNLNDARIVINEPLDGQVLKYDAATGKWKNTNGGSGGVASLGDIPDVELTNLSDGQMIRYNATTKKWENYSLGTAAAKNATSSVTSGSTDLVESGAVYTANQTLTNEVNGKVSTSNIANNLTTTASGKVLDARQGKALNDKIKNKVLYLTGIACSATTGNFVSYSNSAITADHVVAECVFDNPSAITSKVTWTTASGSLTLNGTCSTATTVNVVLVKKDN